MQIILVKHFITFEDQSS